MKILVPTKRVLDTDHRIRIDANGGIDDEGVAYVINPFDAVALEEALRIRENHDEPVEVVAVGIGCEDYQEKLRTALAMGADRAVLVRCDDPLDPWNVAVILHSVVQSESPHLVIMGERAVDDDSNQAGQFLAARLGWPQATFASRVELLSETARVERETDRGVETITVAFPSVITCGLRLNEPRYASLRGMMKSKEKPLDHIELEALGVTLEPRVEILALESFSSNRECAFVESVDELVHRLRHDAKVLG